MIVDQKSSEASSSLSGVRKLSIELPNARQVYTAGAPVVGIVRLGAKDVAGKTMEVKLSIVCVVRSVHYKYYGGTSHDVRREAIKLVQKEQILWASSDTEPTPPAADIPFSIAIPEEGHDKKATNPVAVLPPSFHAGSRRGWRHFGTHGMPIGFVRYHVKVVVVRKGTFTQNNRAFRPFIFLPSSPPPPLLPTLAEDNADPMLLPADVWKHTITKTTLRHNVFSINGHATLHLFLPHVPSFPRLMRIPFVMCLVLTSSYPAKAPVAQPTKATLFLKQTIHTCARGGRQTHVHILDAAPTDNILYGLIPQGHTRMYEAEGGSIEQRYIWRGVWTCRETPSFVNRQISCEYALFAEVPIKGVGNGIKLDSGPVEISSGVTFGTNAAPASAEDALDLPPDYFELDGMMQEDGDDDEEEGKPEARRS